MPVGVPHPRRSGTVFPARAAPGTVVGVGAAAVVAPAFRHVVGGQGAVPVLAAFLSRLGHAQWESGCAVRASGPRLVGWPVGEEQVIIAQTLGSDVSLELA